MTKYCRYCDTEKSVNEFHWANKSSGTRQNKCKSCTSEYMRQRQIAKREELNRKAAEYRNSRSEELIERDKASKQRWADRNRKQCPVAGCTHKIQSRSSYCKKHAGMVKELNLSHDELEQYVLNEKPPTHSRWKLAVHTKDGFRCQFCGSDENLQAHHIFSRALHPDFSLIVNNGITLCFSCHSQEHTLNKIF